LRPFAPARGRTDESWRIGPRRTINDAPVRGNRDDPLRLVATIRRGENTASDIFRRLNSHSRQHAPRQKLKSFGQIVKSLFTPRYVDGLALRRAIERQLNGVELANRFTRAVAVGNPRGLTRAEREEREIAEACGRLVGNRIIRWNHLYLAGRFGKAGDEEARAGPASRHRRSLTHGAGARQHARRARPLRREAGGFHRNPPLKPDA